MTAPWKSLFGWSSSKSQDSPASSTKEPGDTHPPISDEGRQSGFFQKLSSAIATTGKSLFGDLLGPTPSSSRASQSKEINIDDDTLDELEALFLRADVGVNTTSYLIEALRGKRQSIHTTAELRLHLKALFQTALSLDTTSTQPYALQYDPSGLNVYLMVGVNGVGKTTLIGKLAHRFRTQHVPVVIGAGDTFRAAADDQLAVWAERSGATLIRKAPGSDPAAVMYEAIQFAKQNPTPNGQFPVVILDTAGRLQNKFNLMEELKKMKRIIQRELDSAPSSSYEALLVVDATTGQNALQQTQVFKEAVDLTGVALTKLDGSAKGGVILAIAKEHHLPVKLVGVGEGLEDLQDFDPETFLAALFGDEAPAQPLK